MAGCSKCLASTYHENHNKIESYIIFIRDSDEVEGVADQMTDSESWNNLASFLIVVTVRDAAPRQQALCCSGILGQRQGAERGGLGPTGNCFSSVHLVPLPVSSTLREYHRGYYYK
jgi:hypothetical protein